MNCDAIVVLGKRPSPGQGPRELEARAAFAVLFWQQMLPDTPIVCVEGYDLPDSDLSGAETVKRVLIQFGVPESRITAQGLSNCTVREVEALRDILGQLHQERPLAVTHPYHVRRTQLYFAEVGIAAKVVGCSLDAVRRMVDVGVPTGALTLVERGEPTWRGLIRETLVEICLLFLHRLDRQGRIERYWADRLRGSGRPPR